MMGISWRSKAQHERADKWNSVLKEIKKKKEKLTFEAKVNEIGIGFKLKKNKLLTDEIGILFFVRKKLSLDELEKEEIKPVEEIIDDAITDVVEMPTGIMARSETSDDKRYEKLVGGISIIHSEHRGSGTLGIVLRKKNTTNQIPDWVRENAKWWAKGDISDNEFFQGIQHLIKIGVIKIEIPQISANSSIQYPQYLKTTIGWWGEKKTTDSDFINAIKHLIEKNIIKIPPTQLDQGEFYALTNNHVGAREDVIGLSEPAAKKDDEWFQPGFHGEPKKPDDVIGKLDVWNKFLPSGPNRVNYYDVAIARITNRGVLPNEILDIGKISGIKDAEIGDYVLKRGRKTLKKTGIIAGKIPESQTISINYNGQQCLFTDQLIIVGDPTSVPFSSSGDSGSLIVSKDADSNGNRKAVALLFAGGKSSVGVDYTFANPINRIANDFQLNF